MNLKTLLAVVSALAMAQSFALTDVVWKTTKNADNQDVNVSGTLTDGAGVTTGRVKVDYGRTAANPLSGQVPAAVVVATYAGTAPDVSKWRLVNTGVPRMSATFEAVNGEIIMHPGVRGMLLLLR